MSAYADINTKIDSTKNEAGFQSIVRKTQETTRNEKSSIHLCKEQNGVLSSDTMKRTMSLGNLIVLKVIITYLRIKIYFAYLESNNPINI